jgi:hypothetical protein
VRERKISLVDDLPIEQKNDKNSEIKSCDIKNADVKNSAVQSFIYRQFLSPRYYVRLIYDSMKIFDLVLLKDFHFPQILNSIINRNAIFPPKSAIFVPTQIYPKYYHILFTLIPAYHELNQLILQYLL